MLKISGNLPCIIRVVLTPDSLPVHRRHLPRIEQVRRVERRLHPAHEIQSRGAVLVLHIGDLFLADADGQQNVVILLDAAAPAATLRRRWPEATAQSLRDNAVIQSRSIIRPSHGRAWSASNASTRSPFSCHTRLPGRPLRANCRRCRTPRRTRHIRPFAALPVRSGTVGGRQERALVKIASNASARPGAQPSSQAIQRREST